METLEASLGLRHILGGCRVVGKSAYVKFFLILCLGHIQISSSWSSQFRTGLS